MYTNGLSISTPQSARITVHVAVSCISCDRPATRKVCGFLSLRCNKFYKKFSDFSSSLYDRSLWVERTGDIHHSHCAEILKEATKTGIQSAESQYGARNCALLDLPYYNPI